jgi:lipopolysaccharide biosynthesis regulator YciM
MGFWIAVSALVVVLVIALAVRSRQRAPEERPPYILALGALIDGEEDAALEQLKNAVRQDSGNVDAYLRLGELFRRRGDTTRAHHIHRELATRTSLSRDLRARVHQALCRDHIAFGRLERAAEEAREAIRVAPDPAPAQELLLEVAGRRGDHEEAFRVKRELLKRGGRLREGSRELAEFRAEQGRALLEKGELREAEKVLREARKLDGECPTARLLWGELQESEGEYGAAIEEWNALLRSRPRDADAVFRNLERVHFLHGTFSDMEATYHEYLDAVPAHEDAAFGLSRFLRRKGQVDDALDVCRRALDAHPRSPKLRVLCLALLLQSGRHAQAQAQVNDWISDLLGEHAAGEAREDRTPPDPLVEWTR